MNQAAFCFWPHKHTCMCFAAALRSRFSADTLQVTAPLPSSAAGKTKIETVLTPSVLEMPLFFSPYLLFFSPCLLFIGSLTVHQVKPVIQSKVESHQNQKRQISCAFPMNKPAFSNSMLFQSMKHKSFIVTIATCSLPFLDSSEPIQREQKNTNTFSL